MRDDIHLPGSEEDYNAAKLRIEDDDETLMTSATKFFDRRLSFFGEGVLDVCID